MKKQWRACHLDEVITLQRGFDLPERERLEGDVPIVSSSGITGFHNSFKVVAPGVVTGRYGTLGEVHYVTRDFWPLNTTLFVKDFKGNHPRFIAYFLRTLNFSSQNVAGAVPGVNRNYLHMLEVRVPAAPTQRKIAGILAAYDDLIENNARRIAILEAMAQVIYREWFVEFRLPGHENTKFVNSPLGKIPEGWKPTRLGDLAKEVRRGVDPSQVDPDTPYFGLEHLPRKSITLCEWGHAREVQSTKLAFRKGEILFGKIRPYFHKVGMAPVDGICSSDAIVISPKSQCAFGPVLCCVSSEAFVRHATQTSQGTKMPRANWDVLVRYPLPTPQGQLLQHFNGAINEIVVSLRLLMLKNRNLRKTRDLLLPKLISGQLNVEDRDIDTGEVPEEATK